MNINDLFPNGTAMPPAEYSPLALAFLGDSVYELYVRAKIIGEINASPKRLHSEAVKYVKAKAQSDAVKALMDTLTEEEMAVFKRGRNAKSATTAKNADVTDYRYATGFEALLGYLFLKGDNERVIRLCQLATESEMQST